MLTNEKIMEQLSATLENHHEAVLATIISVQGSAYRREGAKMIVEPDDSYHGLISGGCLEADVVEEAKNVLRHGQPFLKNYVLDEDVVWGLGLGCPGTVKILLERVEYNEEWTKQWLRKAQEQEAVVLCKVLEAESTSSLSTGQSLVVSESDVAGTVSHLHWQEQLTDLARGKLAAYAPQSSTEIIKEPYSNEEATIFFDVFIPAQQVFIFGAGHDAVPLAALSSQLGFQTTVIDYRSAFNSADRFPQAKRLLLKEEQFHTALRPNRRTFIIIMNHHMERDREALQYALRSSARYVGILGPRKRREKMLEQLAEMGIQFTEEELAKMYNPIGLDIGADTPEEIALSIMGEIVALRNGHDGGFLKDSHVIHKSTITEEVR